MRRRETVAIGNVAEAPELDDPTLGGREGLLAFGSQAVLAVPIVVFDELIGAMSLHRREPWAWSRDELALAEAVAREIGLALHITGLLRENERRIAQQAALLKSAQTLASDLDLAAVLERLVEQVAELLPADAADCYVYDDRARRAPVRRRARPARGSRGLRVSGRPRLRRRGVAQRASRRH